MITQERLKELLHYNPDTGLFTRAIDAGSGGQYKAGTLAGCKRKDGYVILSIDGKRYFAHRIAWIYMTGVLPDEQIDHKDLNRSNNIFGNLRQATDLQNRMNTRKRATNTSGFKGVMFERRRNKWISKMWVNHKQIHLGYFHNKEDAAKAYEKAAIKYHGDFARTEL
jgi:hypothetical protein